MTRDSVKRTVIVLGIFFGCLLLIWLGVYFWSVALREKIEVYELGGKIEKIEGDTITLNPALYHFGDSEEKNKAEDAKDYRTVMVRVDDKTKFIKILLYLPPSGSDKYYTTDLSREMKEGSFNEVLKKKPEITVRSIKNIYGVTLVLASEIEYYEPVWPAINN